jgi:hypothetical protein
MSTDQCNTGPFELPGSTEHNFVTYPFSIKYMSLWVEPDFQSRIIDCEQQLEVKAVEDIDKINLDI